MLPSNILPDRPISLSRNVTATPKAYFWSNPTLLTLAIFMKPLIPFRTDLLTMSPSCMYPMIERMA
jgi:hypothetical protein